MHRPLSRINSIGTVTLSTLGVLSILLTLSTFWIYQMHPPQPDVKLNVKLQKYTQRWHQHRPHDAAILQVSIQADLRSYWNWNVKQLFVYCVAKYETQAYHDNEVVVWDFIATSEATSLINITRAAKYPLEDKGAGLRGRKIQFSLEWSVMPNAGLALTRNAALLPESVSYVEIPANLNPS
eukprot:PhF_6_TR21900/c0_g1_i1/m.31102/K12948/SPCS3, SPC3; signal peptidase complex subunit 3